jgi:hypothetical protein
MLAEFKRSPGINCISLLEHMAGSVPEMINEIDTSHRFALAIDVKNPFG